jgi:FkbH-like protein
MPELRLPSSPAIAIAATFTAEPLLQGLRFALQEVGLNLDVSFSPYNQVFQELLSPTSVLATNAGGLNVVLIRVEDFVREVDNKLEAIATIRRTVTEFSEILRHHVQRVEVPTVCAILAPSSQAAKELTPCLDEATAALISDARSLPGLTLIAPEDVDLVSTEDRFDEAGDELAHMPFTEEHYASIALAIARKAHALRVPAHKVLVLDCDETLWRGIVGEDGVDGISIPPSLAHLQQFAVNIQAQGALVCLVSKNNERDVLEVFEKRADMTLKLEHVVAHRINWEPKSRNIADLARVLNLGLDSFVFIDDNPVECAQMRAELPQVVTLQLPPDDEIASFISHLWAFDKTAVTDEDMRRTTMYRENLVREEFEDSTTNIVEFIASLDVVTDIAFPIDDEWTRIAQLTQRTNQFNFTTIRRAESELRGLPTSGFTVLRVKTRDRFGDYGLVGLVIANETGDALVVDTLLLSCRVLGRGVEHAIMRRLGELATQRKLRHVELPYVPTPNNEPARAFAKSIAADFYIEEQNRIFYRIPSEFACAIAHQPGHDPVAVIEARRSDRKKASASGASGLKLHQSVHYERLARDLISGQSIVRAARAKATRVRTLPGRPELPATETERSLLAIWQELLGIDGLGVEDDYFALGGTSLIAARLFSEISRRFNVRLPLTEVLDSPTVRALSRRLDQQRGGRSGSLIELKRGGTRNLFLVHDGEGETLLYLNLARRMPADVAVFGIEPRRIARVPLAHTSIEEMAAYYIDEVRKRQPQGPYFFGGMCAGGVIAYEMASQLVRAGESVDLVAILDAAAPRAQMKPGRITKQRLSRLRQVFTDGKEKQLLPFARAGVIVGAIFQKLVNASLWEASRRGILWSARARFRLLRELLARNIAWPKFLPELSAHQIYNIVESRYAPAPLPIPSVLLVRAKTGEGSDTPYRDIYADNTFGWGAIAPSLAIADVAGGHSSMLQEPFIDSLAEVLLTYLQAPEPIQDGQIEEAVP